MLKRVPFLLTAAIVALLAVLANKDSPIRPYAAEALKKIDPKAAAQAGVK